MAQVVIVIPARWGSSRFPGKPLHPIAGVPMIERMWRIGKAVANADAVVVATDDERIKAHIEALGGVAVMTPPECANGTERVWAAVEVLGQMGWDVPEIVINLQGDAVLTPPWTIEAVITEMKARPEIPVGTIATRMNPASYEKLKEAKAAGEVSGTTVAVRLDGRALYFSKSLIPFVRKLKEGQAFPVLRHIGLYAYRTEALRRYLTLPATPLEQVEELEQLRFLEHGMDMQVVEVDYRGRTHWGVDSAADALRAEELIRLEGEVV